MTRKYRLKCIPTLVFIASMTNLATSAQSLPPGNGRAEFQRICSSCHAVNIATNQRMSHSDWAGVVDEMVSRGAQGSPEDLEKVVAYLSANFNNDKSAAPAAVPAQAAAPMPAAQQEEAPLSEAEVSKAKQLIQANGCLSCHRVGDAGSYLGPDLTDIGEHRTAKQIRDSLVSPNKEVSFENRSVRIVTPEGKTVTGKLLGQDGYSVQFIDPSSQLRSMQKSGLREFEIVDQNPMPSYANKISAGDLNNLIHYLSSLKGTGSL